MPQGLILILSRALSLISWCSHEEPQAVIFFHGIWQHGKEFGIEGQIPRPPSPVIRQRGGVYKPRDPKQHVKEIEVISRYLELIRLSLRQTPE